MSGHSKWATTHRQKELVDAKRGAIFTKLANNISVAARKGGDPTANASLRSAIDKARDANMPKDNVERAIKKGTGELGGAQVEELVYEGMGPCGVQVIVRSITDNKNRSGSTIRHCFTKSGGSFSSVMWNFSQKGVFMISSEELKTKNIDFEDLELELIDIGASDIKQEAEGLTIYTELEDFQKMTDFLNDKKITVESGELEYVAKEKLALNEEDTIKVENFFGELEANEDVSDYYTNTDL